MDFLPGLDDLIPIFKENKTKFDQVYSATIITDANGFSSSNNNIEDENNSDEKDVSQNFDLSNPIINSYVTNSLLNCPDSVDSDKPFNYFPSKPHPTSIDYPNFEYSNESLNSLNDDNKNNLGNQHNFCLISTYHNKDFFKKLSSETLFFIFYYGDDDGSNPNYHLNFLQPTILKDPKDILLSKEPKEAINNEEASDEKANQNSETKNSLFDFDSYDNGSYIQYLSLKELYARKWRFNKKLNVWFQKIEPTDPISATVAKSDKLYKFFDFENDWSIKFKEIDLDVTTDEFETW